MTWKVTTNIIDGVKMYGVYRTLDPTEPGHSGNREIRGDYVESRADAERAAKELNRKLRE